MGFDNQPAQSVVDTGIVRLEKFDKKRGIKVAKDYTTVPLRIQQFWADPKHEGWAIRTKLIHCDDEVVRVRARIYNKEGVEVASGHAEEIRGSSDVNTTSAVENCECVPLSVPILTKSGWKFYHQLRIGDDVLSFNVVSGCIEYTPLEAVRVFRDQAVINIGNSRFEATCTENHKWIIDGCLTPWNEAHITGATKILLSARISKNGLNEDDARRLGWLFGDCTIKYNESGLPLSAEITQSKTDNVVALNALFGEGKLKSAPYVRQWANGKSSNCLAHYYWRVSSYELRRILGIFGVNTAGDLAPAVCNMGANEIDAFLDSLLRSDGSDGIFAKTDIAICHAAQLAMFLTGHTVGDITERAGNDMTTKPCYVVSMHKNGYKYLSEFKTTKLPPQDVWCPTTANGTWIGCFYGRPAITGNTSAVGRALGNLGYAGTQFASAEEVVGAIEKQDRFAKIREDFLPIFENIARQGMAHLEECWKAPKECIDPEVGKELTAIEVKRALQKDLPRLKEIAARADNAAPPEESPPCEGSND